MSPSKQIISVRIDRDVLAFFKSQGRGYQTRINAVLRIDLQVAVLVQALDGLDARIGAGDRPAAPALRVHVPLSARRWFTSWVRRRSKCVGLENACNMSCLNLVWLYRVLRVESLYEEIRDSDRQSTAQSCEFLLV